MSSAKYQNACLVCVQTTPNSCHCATACVHTSRSDIWLSSSTDILISQYTVWQRVLHSTHLKAMTHFHGLVYLIDETVTIHLDGRRSVFLRYVPIISNER